MESRAKTSGTTERGSHLVLEIHHNRNVVMLNPDFEAMGAFDTDYIKEGSRVRLSSAPNVPYVWRNGQAVPDEEHVEKNARSNR